MTDREIRGIWIGLETCDLGFALLEMARGPKLWHNECGVDTRGIYCTHATIPRNSGGMLFSFWDMGSR